MCSKSKKQEHTTTSDSACISTGAFSPPYISSSKGRRTRSQPHTPTWGSSLWGLILACNKPFRISSTKGTAPSPSSSKCVSKTSFKTSHPSFISRRQLSREPGPLCTPMLVVLIVKPLCHGLSKIVPFTRTKIID
jgi:hypothetical protein